jgi:hypothetical protein
MYTVENPEFIFFQENFELTTKLTTLLIELLAASLFPMPFSVNMQEKKPSDSLTCSSGLFLTFK